MRNRRYDQSILRGMFVALCGFTCFSAVASGDEGFDQPVDTETLPADTDETPREEPALEEKNDAPATVPASANQNDLKPSAPELPPVQPSDSRPVDVDENAEEPVQPENEPVELKPEHEKVDKNYAAPDEDVDESRKNQDSDATPIQEGAEAAKKKKAAKKEKIKPTPTAETEQDAALGKTETPAPAVEEAPKKQAAEKVEKEKKKAPSLWKTVDEKAVKPVTEKTAAVSADKIGAPAADKVVPKVKTSTDVKEVKDALLPKIAQQPILRQGRGSIVEFQASRTQQNLSAPDVNGARYEISLINLSPASNAWFVLELRSGNGKPAQYHLENAFPASQTLKLDATFNTGIILVNRRGETKCELWGSKGTLADAQRGKPYMPLCDGRLYLRNRIEGYRTTKEWVVEFLRDKMWGGEQITSFVKKTVFKDEYLLQSNLAGKKGAVRGGPSEPNTPPLPMLKPDAEGTMIAAKALGFKLKGIDDKSQVAVGKWHELEGVDHVYVSTIQTNLIADDILNSHKDIVKPLDNVEATAQVYITAFDLSQFEVGFALGTEHPRLGWSERVRESDRVKGWAGPDGFDNAMPLINTGLLNPIDAKRVVGTFTGGFKRSHSAFKWGDLAKKNRGSHYGFIEQGVVFSSLQPDLATIVVDRDGRLSMKTWREEDNASVSDIRFARQNGVAIIDYDAATQQSKPGKFVSNWMHGNWSGSEDMKFRTLRAGMCWVNQKEGQFLLYGYFSSVTPSAMARVFQAYGCQYAMHLDMNALEHTYLATYIQKEDKNYYPQHLINGMKVLDERFEGNVPRFIGYPDNRDFFFILRRFREGLVK